MRKRDGMENATGKRVTATRAPPRRMGLMELRLGGVKMVRSDEKAECVCVCVCVCGGGGDK